MGKTSTRGQKGANSRAGAGGQIWYEGGQTPLFKRTPKRGFKNFNRKELDVVNLARIHLWISQGRLDPTQPITMKNLFDSGLCPHIKHGVKLLGEGAEGFKIPIKIQVSYSSESARKAIEAAGGCVEHVWFNRVTLRAHLKPEKFDILPRSNGVPQPSLYWRYPHLAGPYSFKHKEDEAAFKERIVHQSPPVSMEDIRKRQIELGLQFGKSVPQEQQVQQQL
jgi:ribosomal protein L15